MRDTKSKKAIRDFIYLDIDKLYSLYAQVFDDTADQVLQSYIDGSSSSNNQRESLLKDAIAETAVAEMCRKNENKFLYDHMYNLLEDKIKNAILDSPELEVGNYREVLAHTFMVRVQGSAEIEDYSRLTTFMNKFNDIGEAIAYANLISDELPSEMENVISQITDKNRKVRAKQVVGRQDKKTLAKHRASELGLHHDEQLLKNLNMFVDVFNSEEFDIIISSENSAEDVAFRGVIDKQWLRIKPEFLKSLYGGYVECKWTMVGQITYLPGSQFPQSGAGQIILDEDDANPSMRDPYKNLFRTARVFERMFFESRERIEVVISPIAIYREIELSL